MSDPRDAVSFSPAYAAELGQQTRQMRRQDRPGFKVGATPPRLFGGTANLVFFELKTDLETTTSPATAWLRTMSNTGVFTTDKSETIEIIDPTGAVWARGADSTGGLGACGTGWLHQGFVIVAEIQQVALLCEAANDADFAADATTLTVWSVAACDGGQAPVNSEESLTVYNDFMHAGDASAPCLLARQAGSLTYNLIDTPCPGDWSP